MNSAPKSSLLAVRTSVEEELEVFLSREGGYLREISPDLTIVCDSLTSFLLERGKRLRPLFAYAGFIAAGGSHYSGLRTHASRSQTNELYFY